MGRETYSQYRNRLALRRMIEELHATPAERRADAFAGRVVALWNARLARGADPLLVPTIGAAIRARRHVLAYLCPACGTVGDADLRPFDRHPRASVESLVPALSCSRCPNGPHVRLLGLS
jgi:hypothetical protein